MFFYNIYNIYGPNNTYFDVFDMSSYNSHILVKIALFHLCHASYYLIFISLMNIVSLKLW